MIIAIDFDGTIVESRFPEIVSLLPQAKESINALHDAGHYIIIWTCRTGDNLLNAINFLLENGVKFHRVNEQSTDNLKKYGSNSRKVYAHCYIDDKNIGGFPGWEFCAGEIEKIERDYQQSIPTIPRTTQNESVELYSLVDIAHSICLDVDFVIQYLKEKELLQLSGNSTSIMSFCRSFSLSGILSPSVAYLPDTPLCEFQAFTKRGRDKIVFWIMEYFLSLKQTL